MVSAARHVLATMWRPETACAFLNGSAESRKIIDFGCKTLCIRRFLRIHFSGERNVRSEIMGLKREKEQYNLNIIICYVTEWRGPGEKLLRNSGGHGLMDDCGIVQVVIGHHD